MEDLDKLFKDLDDLALTVSMVDLKEYHGQIVSQQVHCDGEEGAYYARVSKRDFPSMSTAFPVLFSHSLYESEEWPMDNSMWKNGFNPHEWESLLKKIWLPEYLAIRQGEGVRYQYVTEKVFYQWFSVAEKICEKAIRSPILSLVRYGDITSDWQYDYLLETETDYVMFAYWTTG